jgi:N6-adenosine-specific RNA methylase IME4
MVKRRKPSEDFAKFIGRKKYRTILVDPPWRFSNRTGKMAPEHKRLRRYLTLSLEDIKEIPVSLAVEDNAHLYLWVPNALLAEGLEVMKSWGFTYKTNLIWHKIRKDGGPDGRGVGFYFRNTTEMVLFGIRGKLRTLKPGRTQVNIIKTRKREHSKKPDELYDIIEACSPGPYLELFARGTRKGWHQWGDEVDNYFPGWNTYKNHSKTDNSNMGKRKKAVVNFIEHCPNIRKLFGDKFLSKAIESFSTGENDQWSPNNYFISNYLMGASRHLDKDNFITELEQMLQYFLKEHPTYIKSKQVLVRLKSKDRALFEGKWSELIFAYFLNKKDVSNIDLSNIILSENGEKELFDIKTDLGEFEVTTILSQKGIYDTNQFIWGSLEIDKKDRILINGKIKKKRSKSILAIDCTLAEDLSTKLVESQLGMPIDFNVFRKTSKIILLFVRDPQTLQVMVCKPLD